MANDSLLTSSDRVAAEFERQMLIVLKELDRHVLDIIGAKKTIENVFDAQAVLNSRPEMIEALRSSGYNELVEKYVETYKDVPGNVKKDFAGFKLPPPKFATADVLTFTTIAAADIEAFSLIGTRAMDELRLGLYRQSLSSQPFSVMVESVRDATVGTSIKGSPLKNYAYTYANTAHLGFSGEVVRVAGESIEAEEWEVVGPSDGVTRQVCLDALSDPVRTEDEWKSVDYWGGIPGGWNCRHTLYPVVSDD